MIEESHFLVEYSILLGTNTLVVVISTIFSFFVWLGRRITDSTAIEKTVKSEVFVVLGFKFPAINHNFVLKILWENPRSKESVGILLKSCIRQRSSCFRQLIEDICTS